MTTPEPQDHLMTSEAENIAAELGDKEREAVSILGDQVMAGSSIDYEAGVRLFDLGVVSSILAAGHHFTNLTEFGLEIRAILQRFPTTESRGTVES